MSNRVFVHGVPDTPMIWTRLIEQLGGDVLTPCLPGFCSPPPEGFGSTKDDYADWLVTVLEDQYARSGPLDVVGHDWGALLTLRAASLRPDLIRSWAISGAAIDPAYRGHTVARIWNTPVVGEIFMAISSQKTMETALHKAGLPRPLARLEASAWGPQMQRSILSLYRSTDGLRFGGDWVDRLKALPGRGLLIWGDQDPYVGLDVARRFARAHAGDLHIESQAGHWAIVERAEEIAKVLLAHWSRA
jgi:pimeloyl-ACP methyl ester carboxylesterase